MDRFQALNSSASGEQGNEAMARRLALLLELTPVIIRNPDGRILYWNRAAEIMYGFTTDQASGKLCYQLLRTRFSEPLEHILARLRSGRPWQGELHRTRSDGREITVASEWIAHLDTQGRLEAVVEVNKEITDRKQVEAQLAKTSARFEGIIQSAMDAIITTDAEQRIVLFNPAAERMFGVSAAAITGQSLNRLIPQRFRAEHPRQVERFGQTGVSNRHMGHLGKVMGLRATGEEFPLEASISQVEVGGEKFYSVILRDVTQRQKEQEQLQRMQAALKNHAELLEQTVAQRTAQLRESVAELETFSSSLAHDFRAPLRAINTFTHIVLDDYGPGLQSDAKEMLHRVLHAAGRMERLMEDVLAFSRVSRQPLEFRALDVEKLLLDLVMAHPELQPPAAEIQIDRPLLPMLGHEASLTQCLINLLGNAVKFVAPNAKPEVRIWTELRSPEPSTPDAPHPASSIQPPASGTVRLWVADNGLGIPAEAHLKIFDVFHRYHSGFEGTGLGLAIVKKAIERMGGRVGVESAPGQGSRFWIELPQG